MASNGGQGEGVAPRILFAIYQQVTCQRCTVMHCTPCVVCYDWVTDLMRARP